MPSDRGNPAPDLPRWVSSPRVLDWVTEDEVLGLVERERKHLAEPGGTLAPGPVLSPEEAARRFAFVAAYGRFIHALDITFGTDVWPSSLAGGSWAWDAAPGGPAADLLAAVCAVRTGLTGIA